ncbi:TonB-dependent receptor [Sphingobium sp. AR-3-1]|uniref:TonB-dependent receptor n=1 Tax=Sphingobium psychrophilum TaxID=2728834 RepID=A0A7X9WY39_9SPHN|nr:TonB-dependent receptor [Sphingobium psychrophilum]NML12033.1 TonB-dependent receptor [Sphingobium psychrophilum]
MNAAKALLLSGVAGLVMGTAAQAQEAQDSTAQPSQYADIIVTANKRQENINKVGLTITAISADQLQERKIVSLSDVASAVPGLTFTPSVTNTPIFTLRGVGFNESSLGVYPAVSVYIDQAPLPFPVMASHAAFDLERIEVLKGPQGTLFGQNATGGAINYIAAKPTDTFEAGGDITYGRFNQIDGNAYISGPLTDNLNGRIAMTAHHLNDWQYSLTRPTDTNGSQDYIAGRILLDWQASERLKLAFNLNGSRDTSDPQAIQYVAMSPTDFTNVKPIYANQPFAYGNARVADWTHFSVDPYGGPAGTPTDELADFSPKSKRTFIQASVRADYDLTDDMTLTSITTYDHFKQNQRTDGEGVAAVGFDLQKSDGKLTSFNQELRIANASTSALRYIIGGNYERSTTSELQHLRYYDNDTNNAGLMFINFSGDLMKQKITNYAAFGNLEFDISSQLTLKGGVRYTQSKNQAYNCGFTDANGYVNDLFNFLGGLLGTAPFTPIGPEGCYTLNDNNVPGEPFRKTLKEDNVSWRVGVDYKVTDTTLLYANVSRGYKAGSFPALAASGYVGLQPVVQESVTAYEAGLKAQLFDRAVQFNAAGFYYDYRNKQIRGKLLDPLFGVLDILINIPKSRIYGGEADVTIRPAAGLTLSGGITYLNSKLQKGPVSPRDYNIIGEVDDFGAFGDALPYTPEWSGTASIDYHTPGDGGPFVGVSTNFRSSQDAALGGSRIVWPDNPAEFRKQAPIGLVYKIPGYATVDARLGYEAPGGAWKVMLWGKNVFNKYYIAAVVPASASAGRLAGMPATYGVTMSFKIK